jgi:DNA-binding NtrC family response regulator
VDCSSLSDTLLESELFGLKGTSDDSTRDSLGFIRAADGGSIFLDEISQLSLPLQGKLLRVLRDKAVTPVGAVTSHPVDVRIIAATNRDLDAMVQQGHFLGDLFQLLGSCVLRTPPLRDRLADIVPLAHHFLAILAELHDEPLKMISDPVIQVLQTYPWPGNVRELSNILEQAHVLASNDSLQLSDLPLRLQVGVRQATEIPESLSLDELEKQAILTALRRCNFNRAAAGRMLGISTPRLKRRIARLGL